MCGGRSARRVRGGGGWWGAFCWVDRMGRLGELECG